MDERVNARLEMLPESEGGLHLPLKTPTLSLQFRPVANRNYGLVGVIYLPDDVELVAGARWDAVEVLFPIAETDPFVVVGNVFELWNDRKVGIAEIVD